MPWDDMPCGMLPAPGPNREIFESLISWLSFAGENGPPAAESPALAPEMPSPLGGAGCWGRGLGRPF